MQERKTESADIDKFNGIFFQIGLIIALVIPLIAFEWKTYDKSKVKESNIMINSFDEEIIQITKREEPPPPPKPEPVTTLINIVEDNVIVENDILVNTEADQTTEVSNYVAPVETPGEQVVQEEEIFTIVEEQPSFPGGEEARIKFIASNIKYPQIARENGIEGKVFVTFVVEKDGSITNVKLLRDIGGGCGEEAIRVVKAMPKWIPGKQRGQPVRVQFNMPINFVLQ
ncbi:MAG TPA: energy transducer TonB [Bacteroidales bacterium]|mgnify:CR=1 FL=1|nr:energy transducer TonB [Bacteroidales bacterium]